jgi:hypothetical protein
LTDDELRDNLEFEERIKEWNPAEQFLAREIRKINLNCVNCNGNYKVHKKQIATTTAIASLPSGVLVYLLVKAIAAHFGLNIF